MARRVLNARLYPSLLLGLSLASCRHEDRAPAPSASVSAAASDFTAQARERHLEDELSRANARWQTKPNLAVCAAALKEKADLALCQAAESSLAAITESAPSPPQQALTRLAAGALALARLAERVRYLSLAELAQRRVEGDAGAPPATSASSAVAGAKAALSRARKGRASDHHDQHAVQLSEGPMSQLLDATIRLERDVIRNLGAYLEYGALPVRHAAFDTVKGLRNEHPRWPALDHLLRDAAVLEADGDLKRSLRELSGSGLPPSRYPNQSAETK